MRRDEKGPWGPPPTLAGPAGEVAGLIASWPGVEASVHWHFSRRETADGADFYVGDEELGHIHCDGWAHIRLNRAARDAALKRGIGTPAPWAGYDDWLHLRVDGPAAAAQAVELFRQCHSLRHR